MSDILELLDDTANFSEFESVPMELIECDSFQHMLEQNERNEFNWKRIVINKNIVVNTPIHLKGTQSILKFDGGSIQLKGDSSNQSNIISGFQIEVYCEGSCFKISNCGLQFIACTIENMFNSNSQYFIEFNNQLQIYDTTIIGFRRIARFMEGQINLNVQNSKIKCPIYQEQDAFFSIQAAQGGQIHIDMSKFKGSQIGVHITDCVNQNITISESKFSKQQTALIISNVSQSLIHIQRNLFKKATKHAIIMQSVKGSQLIVERNQIIQCGIGILLKDVMQEYFPTLTINKDTFGPIVFRYNVLKQIEQTAIILKEVVCIQIESSFIVENSIGLDINISTDHHSHQEGINPFIINVFDCSFNYNRIHGMFINGDLEKQPVYLQISESTFKSNRNIMNLSHQGASQQSKIPNQLGFKINIHGCFFKDNLNSNFSNPYYDIITTKTNITQSNQNSTKCSIM